MGGWEEERRNRNRGYRELVVWQDAITLLRQTSLNLSTNEYHLRRLVSQQLACVDSVHRNIAEGWCRRGLGEYLYFLNVALASLGEAVSGLTACRAVNLLDEARCKELDALSFKIENGLLKLIEALRNKAEKEGRPLRVREVAEDYGEFHDPALTLPIPQAPTTPGLLP